MKDKNVHKKYKLEANIVTIKLRRNVMREFKL